MENQQEIRNYPDSNTSQWAKETFECIKPFYTGGRFEMGPWGQQAHSQAVDRMLQVEGYTDLINCHYCKEHGHVRKNCSQYFSFLDALTERGEDVRQLMDAVDNWTGVPDSPEQLWY